MPDMLVIHVLALKCGCSHLRGEGRREWETFIVRIQIKIRKAPPSLEHTIGAKITYSVAKI